MSVEDIVAKVRNHIEDTAKPYKVSDVQIEAAVNLACDMCQIHDYPAGAPYSVADDEISPTPDARGEAVLATIAAARLLWMENVGWATGELRFTPGDRRSWRDIVKELIAAASQEAGGVPTIRIIQTIGIDEYGLPDQRTHTVDTYEGDD